MAYFSQEQKAEKMPKLKALCAKYGVKASFGVRHNSTFFCTISSSSRINFMEDCDRGHQSVNEYYIKESFKGEAKDFLLQLKEIMMEGNWNNSDPMSDYFDVGWYISISIGRWDKPFVFDPLVKKK